ncbi:MAG: hypothetical protein OXH14_18365, partial [Alphaproteobacteria bacterium]|nr:hypothetical protein [Alphaproteobacteria bacterium]
MMRLQVRCSSAAAAPSGAVHRLWRENLLVEALDFVEIRPAAVSGDQLTPGEEKGLRVRSGPAEGCHGRLVGTPPADSQWCGLKVRVRTGNGRFSLRCGRDAWAVQLLA